MATISQQPARLDLAGVLGDPFALTINVTLTDSNDDSIPWSDVSSWVVAVATAYGVTVPAAVPTVTSPSTGVLLVSWSGVETAAIPSSCEWGLSFDISGVECTPLAGKLTFQPATSAGPDSPTSADLAVAVGTSTATLQVTTGGGGGGGGSVDSVVAGTSIHVDDTDPDNPVVSVPANTFDAYGAATTAQTNAEAYTDTETSRAETAEALKLAKASNLSDVASASTSRTNLGLGTAATHASTDFDAAGAATTAQTNAEAYTDTETSRAETAEGLLAPKASPAFTGSPTAPTKTALDNSTKLATTAYADAATAVELARAEAAEAVLTTATTVPGLLPSSIADVDQISQNLARRGGTLGAATASDAISQFPFGQVDVVLGDSIAAEAGASQPGVTGWATQAATDENRLLGLPDPGSGFVYATNGGGLYSISQFANTSNGTAVNGYLSLIGSGQGGGGVQLTGTINNVSSIVSDTRVFRRVVVFYEQVAGADGLAVSLDGGTTFQATALDPNNAAAGTPSNGTDYAAVGVVKVWDSGDLGVSPAHLPQLQFKRVTKVSGAGGTAPTVFGARFYGAASPGTAGSIVDNLAVSHTATNDWVLNRTWENHLGAVNALSPVRRVQIRLSANDYFIARTVADCVTNSTTAITSATAAFEQGDVGRPVTGSSDFQAGTTISAVTDGTHATLSLAATGSHSGQTLALGIMPLATVTANLTTVITRARAQAPLAEIVLAAEYHVGGSSRPYPMSVATYAANWVPAIASVAYLTGCTFLDEYARWGPIGVLTSFADCTLNNGSPIIASSATAQFTQADVGTYVQGANIPPLTTILSVQSTTSATMSANAQGSASGTYKIGSDIHGVSMVDWTHLGDSTNSNSGIDGQRAHGEFVVERTGFGKRIPYAPPAVVQITSTATTTWLCPRTGVYRITCIGGGGSGGGGGSPTNSSATLQVGGAGGGQGSVAVAYMSLTAGTLYTLAVGAGGAQVNGGAGNGSHAGTAGNAGGNTTFTVGSVVVTAYGGGGGPAGGANSTTDILGGTYGGNLTTTFTPVPTAATIGPPGYGGATWSSLHLGLGGGIPVPPGAGGGGAGASASSTLGGLGALGGAYASAGISGNTATTAGGAGGAGTQPGGGGGGGGGGAGTATSGAGGTGGAGGAGAVLIEKVG